MCYMLHHYRISTEAAHAIAASVHAKIIERQLAASKRQATTYNKGRRDVKFNVGDLVFIVEEARVGDKFTSALTGPVKVLEFVDDLHYIVARGLAHDVDASHQVHVERMKLAKIRTGTAADTLLLAARRPDNHVVESVVGHKRLEGRHFFQIKWLGWEASANTWEPLAGPNRTGVGKVDLVKTYMRTHGLVASKADKRR